MSNFTDEDLGFKKLMTTFSVSKNMEVMVGFLRSEPHKKSKGATVAQVALWNEFGTPTIPERAFFRTTMSKNASKISTLITKLATKVSEGTMTTRNALQLVGEFIKGEIVATINNGVPPPNAPSTIARKGSSKPLIDSGQLKNSVDVKVRSPGEQ